MWARVVEFMLACWLGVSPFVFQHGDQLEFWIADWTVAVLVGTLSLACYWRPLRHGHLGILLVTLCLGLWARFSFTSPLPSAAQNEITVALLLMMVAIVPNHASVPPVAWLAQDDVTPAATPKR
jgi:hypothetical protein